MSIEHLNEGIDTSALHDLDGYLATSQSGTPSQEYVEMAEGLLTQHTQGKQFTLEAIMALASLLFQLYTYFRDHRAARFIISRAASHPHGLAAQLVNHKIETKLPVDMRGVPNLASGVTLLTDTVLTKNGV